MLDTIWRNILHAVEGIGSSPDDTADVRLQKSMLAATALLIAPAAVVWGLIYVYFDEPLAGSIPLGYSALSFASLATFAITRRYGVFRVTQLLLLLLLPFLLLIALGGFVSSSAVVLWSLTSPLGALFFAGRRESVVFFLAYLGLLVASGVIEPFIGQENNLPSGVVTLFFVMNTAVVSAVTFVLLLYFTGQKDEAFRLLDQEQQRSEGLLLNVLPKDIAALLKDGSRTIADHFDAVSILFADVVGFTTLTAKMAPGEMVGLLNEFFSYFDSLVEKYGLEKIRTIGDNYMVAAGVPRPRNDHADALARMALEMIEYCSSRATVADVPLQFRIGMNSGPTVAGVIGHKKFQYDLWGDAVNTASRMESHGVPGKIQVTRETYDLIKDDFVFTARGAADVKGKGNMETWFLDGVRP